MTLNASYATARPILRRALEGSDRGLDVLVGLVILTASLMIGSLTISTLYEAGLAAAPSAVDLEGMQAGFLVAAVGSAAAVGVTTINYLARIIRGRRSWTAPLWGLVLMGAALVIGNITMASAL